MRVRKDLSQLLVSLLTIKVWGSIKEGCGCLCLRQKIASRFWWLLPVFAKDGAAVAYLEKTPAASVDFNCVNLWDNTATRMWRWGVKVFGQFSSCPNFQSLSVPPITLLPQVFVFSLLENHLIMLKKSLLVSTIDRQHKILNAAMLIINLIFYLAVSISTV